MAGWNGKHCTLVGCPSNCMWPHNGQCEADNEGIWSCKCNAQWEGIDCSVKIEMNCNDGVDNDDGKEILCNIMLRSNVVMMCAGVKKCNKSCTTHVKLTNKKSCMQHRH